VWFVQKRKEISGVKVQGALEVVECGVVVLVHQFHQPAICVTRKGVKQGTDKSYETQRMFCL
jgi:hypothetical protein